MSEYYILDGTNVVPVNDVTEWALFFEREDRRLAKDTIPERQRFRHLFQQRHTRLVSTVFLGIDHQFGNGPPLVFETMIFTSDDGGEIYCERYSTYEEALIGHKKACNWVRAGEPPRN